MLELVETGRDKEDGGKPKGFTEGVYLCEIDQGSK